MATHRLTHQAPPPAQAPVAAAVHLIAGFIVLIERTLAAWWRRSRGTAPRP